MDIKKSTLTSTTLLIVISVSFLFFAFSTGITGRTKKGNQQGCTCHGNNATTSVIVTISGPDNLKVNEEGNYTVTITGGPLLAAGTNIAASSGTLTELSGLQLMGDELTHTSPKDPSSGSVTFNFKFKAPSSVGQATLYANGNSVNKSGSSSGDSWNFAADKIITINPATDINDDSKNLSFALMQNFPNPFSSNSNSVSGASHSTNIKYQIAERSFVTLKLFDILGNEIATLINNEMKEAGSYNYSLLINNYSLPSGIYLYRLYAGNFTASKKMIITK